MDFHLSINEIVIIGMIIAAFVNSAIPITAILADRTIEHLTDDEAREYSEFN